MIKLQNYTPKVYYSQSRDFQFIGRLYDIVLNSVKTNIDLLSGLPLSNNIAEGTVDLLALLLGFKPKHQYSVHQLIALGSVFSQVLKKKGSLEAVNIAGKALLNSEGIKGILSCTVENGVLTITFPGALSDFNLFKDLLDYILPAGLPYRVTSKVIKNNILHTEYQFNTGKLQNANLSQVSYPEQNKVLDPGQINQLVTTPGNKKFNTLNASYINNTLKTLYTEGIQTNSEEQNNEHI